MEHKMLLWHQIAKNLLRAFNILRIRQKRRRRRGRTVNQTNSARVAFGIKSFLEIFLQIQIEMYNRTINHEGGFLFLVVYFFVLGFQGIFLGG